MAACSRCAGLGTVVEPVLVWDNEKKDYVLLQRAVACVNCGGTGKI